MNYHLISAIIKSVWAIDETAALSYSPLIGNLLGQSKVAFEFDKNSFNPIAINRVTGESFVYDSEEEQVLPEKQKYIAIVPLSGPLMKNDQYCGPVGMATIGRWIKDFDASPKVDGIILKVDSPGGTVDGTAALAEIVKNTKTPIIAFVDGLAASAALWISSAADEIIASDNKAQIGSIGTMLSFIDVQPYFEKMGVKFHSIVAEQSKDKNKLFNELREGNYENYKKEVLNPLAADFINHVKQNLEGVKDDQLTGKVYFAENVIGSLVTSIGNMDFAIGRMNKLITKNESNSNSNKNNATMKKFEAIDNVVGAELQTTDEGAHLNQDELESVNTAIEQGVTDAAALGTANTAQTAAEEAQATAEASLVTANETIATQVTEIATLKNKPGAQTAKVVTGKDKVITGAKDGNVVDDNKSFFENLDAITDDMKS